LRTPRYPGERHQRSLEYEIIVPPADPAVARRTQPVGHPANADVPTPGNARLYRDHRDYAAEVNPGAIIARLAGYDSWPVLPDLPRLCSRSVAA